MQNVSFIEVKGGAIEKISQVYGRNADTLKEDVNILKTWMKTQQHLPEILDDKRIQNFLFLNKCSIERAKRSIDSYYTLRSKIPDMFENVNPKCENMKQQFEIAYWVPLPKMTDEMYRIQVFKLRNKDMVDILDPHDVLATGFALVQEIRLKEDVMFGDIYIFDYQDLPFSYVMKITPVFVAKIVALYEKIYAIPLKGLYFVNSPTYINIIIATLKKLLKPKLFERVHISEDTSALKNIPNQILPKDYGGEEKSLQELQGLLMSKLREHQDRFDELDKLRVDESLRPEELRNDDHLGFHGNFRKLGVD